MFPTWSRKPGFTASSQFGQGFLASHRHRGRVRRRQDRPQSLPGAGRSFLVADLQASWESPSDIPSAPLPLSRVPPVHVCGSGGFGEACLEENRPPAAAIRQVRVNVGRCRVGVLQSAVPHCQRLW